MLSTCILCVLACALLYATQCRVVHRDLAAAEFSHTVADRLELEIQRFDDKLLQQTNAAGFRSGSWSPSLKLTAYQLLNPKVVKAISRSNDSTGWYLI